MPKSKLENGQISLKTKNLKKYWKKAKRSHKRGVELEKQAIKFLKTNNILTIKNGWPDLLLEINGSLVFLEIKTGVGESSHTQRKMHKLLRKHGLTVIVLNLDSVPDWKKYILKVLNHKGLS